MDIKRAQFNCPEDHSHQEPEPKLSDHAERELVGVEPSVVSPGVLLGGWLNVDPATRSLSKVELTIVGGKFMVRPYGACAPTPCDWGRQAGVVYAGNVESKTPVAFTASFPAVFKETIVTGHLDGTMLVVETFNHFEDGSNRSDYFTRETFRRG